MSVFLDEILGESASLDKLVYPVGQSGRIETKSGKNFLQKAVIHSLLKEDCLILWRRLDNGEDTYLAVIWHKNWRHRHEDSQICKDPNEVESWVIKTLSRIHYSQKTFALVKKEFRCLVNDEDFSIEKSSNEDSNSNNKISEKDNMGETLEKGSHKRTYIEEMLGLNNASSKRNSKLITKTCTLGTNFRKNPNKKTYLQQLLESNDKSSNEDSNSINKISEKNNMGETLEKGSHKKTALDKFLELNKRKSNKQE